MTALLASPTTHNPPLADRLPPYMQATFRETPEARTAELIGSDAGLGFTLALAETRQILPYQHPSQTDNYTVIAGRLKVERASTPILLRPGESLHIPQDTPIAGTKLGRERAHILVVSVPQPTTEHPIFNTPPPETYRNKITFPTFDCYRILGAEECLCVGAFLVDVKQEWVARATQSSALTVIAGEINILVLHAAQQPTPERVKPGGLVEIPKGVEYQIIPEEGPARILMVRCPIEIAT